MSLVTSLILSILNCLPWIAIAFVATIIFKRRKGSATLLLQAGSAAALFLLPLARLLVVQALLISLIKADVQVISAAEIIFGFLLFVALATFAVSYCIDTVGRNKSLQASATPS